MDYVTDVFEMIGAGRGRVSVQWKVLTAQLVVKVLEFLSSGCSDPTHQFSLSSAEINLFHCPDKTTDNHELCCTGSVQDITHNECWITD